MRGATTNIERRKGQIDVSIHAPREGCDSTSHVPQGSDFAVSIHAPREGCDRCIELLQLKQSSFNSRTPCGVRLWTSLIICVTLLGFNSRTPCGVRQSKSGALFGQTKFQFTHPVRGATFLVSSSSPEPDKFQFTHPVRGATSRRCSPQAGGRSFNSRTPCGVRHILGALLGLRLVVSIHAPRAGCDARDRRVTPKLTVSIHAPRAGCDRLTNG